MPSARRIFPWLALALAVLSIGAGAGAQSGDLLVYLGTYTGPNSQGIYVSHFDGTTGALTPPVLAAETPNPSFLASHPSHEFLYAVNEVNTFEGARTGSVSAFAIDRASGKLTLLNVQPSGGADPAHLTVARNGRHVFAANYSGGSVAVLPLDGDGRLRPPSAIVRHSGSSVDPQRQQSPHAHAIVLDAASRFAYAADLGLDQVLIYRFDAAAGTLAPADPPFERVRPGSGPRHVAIHPSGRFAYVINEMACTITAFRVDAASGALKELQTTSTLPAGQTVEKGFSTAEIMVHPSGKFVYGSNRGHNTIAVFAIDESTGRLALIEHEPTQGSTPRGFGIDPGGTYMLVGNQRSDSVVVFRIDAQRGALAPTGHTIKVGSPVSIEFVSSARGERRR